MLYEVITRLTREKNKSFRLEVGFDADMDAGSIELPKLSADLLGLEVHVVGDAAALQEVEGAVRSAWEVVRRL